MKMEKEDDMQANKQPGLIIHRRITAGAMVLLILLACLTSAGCRTGQTTASQTTAPGTSSPTTTSAPTTSTTTAATTAGTTASVVETTAPTTTGVTEIRLGFVESASSSGLQVIEIDYVEMYSGAEAIEKALEDDSPVVEVDEDGHQFIANDYYIRNNNAKMRTFELSPDCIIRMIPDMGGPEPSLIASYAELRTALAERKRLMEIEVVNGLVENMVEVYLP
jgi:hypothetical protein